MEELRRLAEQASALQSPQERPFTSSTPVLGPVIIWVRRAWNSMSTRWYVLPILEQQVRFNSTLVQAVNEISSLLERQGREAEEWNIAADRASAAMATDLSSLRHRLNQMESRLPEELASLRETLARLEQALAARQARGGIEATDADRLL